jgi:hypothetical protein
MTSPYPQYPQQPPAQYPAQQGYAPPPQQYAPPAYQPSQPQYPAQPQYAPQAPQQGYTPPPAARGSLDEFYSQPGGGSGKPLSFTNKPPGTGYTVMVARTVTSADIMQQTDTNRVPLHFKDGRPKFVMIVPLTIAQSPEYPEGSASWWVKGQSRDELSRAMTAAGAPEGPPEAGAILTITFTGERQIPGRNAQKIYHVSYQRPQGNGAAMPAPPAQVVQPAPAAQQPTAPNSPAVPGLYAPPAGVRWPAQPEPVVPQGQTSPNPYPQPGQAQPGYAPAPMLTPDQHAAQMAQNGQAPAQPQYPAQVQQLPPGQYAPPAGPAQVPQQNAATPVPPGLTPEQQELLARLSGQPAPQG